MILKIDKFYGGLSSGSRLGIDGSFYFGKGLNYKEDPDAITANLALVKDSGSTVTGLVKWITFDTVNDNHYFYDDGGRLYRRTSSGAWSNIRSVANSHGQGLEVFNNYLWYAQDGQLGRYGPLSGAPGFTDNYRIGLSGSTSWRPLKQFLNMILVGNGKYLATEDNTGSWNAQRLTFPDGWYVRDIDVMGDYAVIACNDGEDVTRATRGILFFWDGTSSTFNFFSELNEGGGISSIQANQDSIWINGGVYGNYYLYTGKSNKVKRIPFIGTGKTAYVWPGADCNFNGMVHFGISDGTSTTVYRGVYSFGRPEVNYPNSLNFEYPISTGTIKGTGVQIGAVYPFGNRLFVAWKDGTNYGVDLLSTSTLQTSVLYQSRIMSFDSEVVFTRFKLFFEPLTSGESIELKYYRDQESSSNTIGTADYSSDGTVTYKLFNEEFRCTDIMFEIEMSGSSTMPTVTKLLAEYEPTRTL